MVNSPPSLPPAAAPGSLTPYDLVPADVAFEMLRSSTKYVPSMLDQRYSPAMLCIAAHQQPPKPAPVVVEAAVSWLASQHPGRFSKVVEAMGAPPAEHAQLLPYALRGFQLVDAEASRDHDILSMYGTLAALAGNYDTAVHVLRRAAILKPDSKLAQLAANMAADVRAMARARMAKPAAPAAVPGASLWTAPDQAAQDILAAGWPPSCRRPRSRRGGVSASEQPAGRAHGQPSVRGAPIGVEQPPTQVPQAAQREPDAADHTSSITAAGPQPSTGATAQLGAMQLRTHTCRNPAEAPRSTAHDISMASADEGGYDKAGEQPEHEARTAQATRGNLQFSKENSLQSFTPYGGGLQYHASCEALTELHRRMTNLEWPQDPRAATEGWKAARDRRGMVFFQLPDDKRIRGYGNAIHFLAAENVPRSFRDVWISFCQGLNRREIPRCKYLHTLQAALTAHEQ